MVNQDIDTRSDIYSLGVVLYQLLTGALPFSSETLRGGGIEHVRKVICELDPKTPSTRLTALGEEAKKVAQDRQTDVTSLARRLARELEWIPLKAVRKDRTRRYRSAAEFADDIDNYLRGAPLIAGPESVIHRKVVRMHRGPFAAAGVVAFVLVLATVVSTVLYGWARDRAEDYRRLLYVNQTALAHSAYREADIDRARKLLADCPADLREFAWSYLWRLAHIVPETPTIEHSDPVNAVAFSPTAGTIATASGNSIALWHASTHKIQTTLEGHTDAVQSLAFSRDAAMLISAGIDGAAIVWDVAGARQIHSLASPIGLSRLSVAVALSSDGKTAAVSFDIGRAGAVLVVDVVTGEYLSLAREGADTRVFGVAFSSDGRALALGERGKTTLWDTASNKQVATFAGGGHIDAVAFLNEDRTLVTAGTDGMLRLWDVTAGKKMREINAHVAPIHSMALSANGEILATASADSTIRLWDTATWQETGRLRGHTSEVYDLDFSADGDVPASASKDCTVKLWEPYPRSDSDTLVGHNGLVDDLVFTSDSKRLISAAFRRPAIKMWDVSYGRDLSDTLDDLGKALDSLSVDWAGGLVLSPGGRTLAVATEGLVLWNLPARQKIDVLSHENDLDGGTVNCAVFSPDGKTLGAHTYAGTFKLWDVPTLRELIVLEGYGSHFAAAAFSQDGRMLAIPERNRLSITLWETSALRAGRADSPVATLVGHSEEVNAVAFSPDGATLASAGNDTTIKLWEPVTQREITTLTGHTSGVHSLAFSPDGRTLASGGNDGTVRLWNMILHEQVAVLEGHGSSVWKIAFSPDGQTLASTSLDATIRLWRAAPQ